MRGLHYGYGGLASPAWEHAQNGDLDTLAAILRYCQDPFSEETSDYRTTPYTAIISECRRHLDRDLSTDAHEAMLKMFLQRGYPMPR